jgi:hypothetical protein
VPFSEAIYMNKLGVTLALAGRDKRVVFTVIIIKTHIAGGDVIFFTPNRNGPERRIFVPSNENSWYLNI